MQGRHRLPIAGLLVVALAVALTVIATAGYDSLATDGIIYVDVDAPGPTHDGSTWDYAFTSLQPALEAAGTGTQIWVAEGTYTPTEEHGGSGDRYKSFQMLNGVALYGGFDGTEDFLHERDWAAHPTILSGDLDGDDGEDFANNDENSYHVFFHPEEYIDLDSTAILDGFTITGGNANSGDYPDYHGGGMYNSYSSPMLTDCTFSDNSATGGGGGVHNHGSSPTLTGCTFSDNSAGGGGGMANAFSSPVLFNCAFEGNRALSSLGGGGMLNLSSSPTLTNCTLSGNSANYKGGGMDNQLSSSPTLTNCILWGNTPEEISNSDSTPDVTYSNIQGGYDGVGNIDSYPFFADPANGDFHLGACSPCIDAGNNEAANLPDHDFEGDDRIVDGDDDGTPIVDMGVDEVIDGLPCWHVYLPLVLRN